MHNKLKLNLYYYDLVELVKTLLTKHMPIFMKFHSIDEKKKVIYFKVEDTNEQ